MNWLTHVPRTFRETGLDLAFCQFTKKESWTFDIRKSYLTIPFPHDVAAMLSESAHLMDAKHLRF